VKLQAMEEEVERTKDMYYSLRRELDRSKSEFDAYSALQERELNICREERDVLIEGLKRQLAEVQEMNFAPEKDEQIRSMKLKVRETEYVNDTLREELLAARKARDDAMLEKSQRVSACEHEEQLLRVKMAVLLADTTAAENRANAFASECEKKESALKASRTSVKDLESNLLSLRKVLDDKNHELAFSRTKFVEEMKSTVSSLEASKEESESRCLEMQTKLHERDETCRRLQWDIQELHASSEASDRKLRAEQSQKVKEFKSKTDSLELELAETRLQLKTVEMRSLSSQDQHQKDLGVVKSEKSRIHKEKEIVEEKLRSTEFRLEDLSTKVNKSEKDWLAKLHSSEDVIRSLREHLDELQLSYERTTKQMNETTETMHAANSRAEAYLAQLDELKRESQGQHEVLARTFKDKLLQLKQTFKKSIDKEKKRSDGYKDKALIAHEKLKEILGSNSGRFSSLGNPADTAEIF